MQTLSPAQIEALRGILAQAESGPDKNPPLLEIWDIWVNSLDLTPQAKANHYENLRRQIVKAGNPSSADAGWFTANEDLAPVTLNNRLTYLKKMADWAMGEGLISINPWLKVKPRKNSKKIIKPFTKEESAAIVAGFQKSYPAWVPFTKFLFLSGCRLSEAIGLCWRHVDFSRLEVCICESLPIAVVEGCYQRRRKDTKTGSVRFLKINAAMGQLLKEIKPAAIAADDLIFTNPTGTNYIDSHNFRDRWRKVLAATGIPYRRPHIIRHSFASHAIEQGMPLTSVAYLLGHADTRMVAQTYGHLINRPSLPDIL